MRNLPASSQNRAKTRTGRGARVASSAAAAASLSAVRRLASTRTQVSSWRTHPAGIPHGAPAATGQSPATSSDGRGDNIHVSSACSFSSSLSTTSSSTIAAATARQELRRQQHQLQANAPVEVSPGDDDASGGDDGHGRARDHDSEDHGVGGEGGAYGMVIAHPRHPRALGRRQAAAAVGNHGSTNRRGTGSEHRLRRNEQEEVEEDNDDENNRSLSYLLCGRPCPLATVEDLPDSALGRAFFSGFLDSLEIVLSLRLVSRRMMDVGSTACQVTCAPPTLCSVASFFSQAVRSTSRGVQCLCTCSIHLLV